MRIFKHQQNDAFQLLKQWTWINIQMAESTARIAFGCAVVKDMNENKWVDSITVNYSDVNYCTTKTELKSQDKP